MTFVPDKNAPQFEDLKGMLNQSKQTDNALYRTIHILLERLEFVQNNSADVVNKINDSVNNIVSNVTVLSNNTATYLTTADESVPLAHSSQLLAGANITFDDTIPNKRIINATGSGGTGGPPDPHHVTHEPGGSDPMEVDAISTKGSLRTLGSGPNQAAPGNDIRFDPNTPHVPTPHAPTHSAGASDPVDVRNLAGYPGNNSQFLRADATFAAPPGGGTGGGMNLDYLGDFVSGPTYNDGDIVIGSDGVLYMCTVDGTVTPPEPWPGAGIAINGTVDATYWTVSPHSQLTNERALNALGTGYVRSTVGEPSVVPTIPLTDTTGILPDNRLTANVALVNRDNNFVAQTMGSQTTVSGPNSIFNLRFPGALANQRWWRFVSYGGGNSNLYVEALNDVGGITAQFAFGGDNQLYGQGGGLINLNAAALATGVANPARLGNGVANSTTFLRGDSTWAPVPVADPFPSGLIVISVSPCPVGWTRIGWDGYMIRGSATPGSVGGADTHAHTLGNLQIPSHDHGGQISGTVDADGNHSHAFSGSGQGSTGTSLGGTSGADAGGSFTAPYAAHTHDFSVTVSGQTGDGGFHAHNFRTGIPSQGAIGVVGGMDAASNVPLYVGVYFCQKN